ncbi:HAD family phosphatase, partial [Candidatus Woesearchaeota archaeon]|nr:HAD family phosphatase [Candidatus Woesearchaeota archaeon]
MVEAIIFDHDGVMVDTEPLQSKAWIEMLKKYGKEPELYENGLVHIVGISIDENWKILKEKYNVEEEIDSLEEQRGEIYFNLLKEAQPIEGLMDLLKDLNKEKISKGIMLAIASSSNKEYIEAVVKKFGFEEMFDLIVTRKDVEKGKPNPDIYLKVANEFRVKPSD